MTIPTTVKDGSPAGAGNLETTGSQDVYAFTVPSGGQTLVVDGTGSFQPLYHASLRRADTGQVVTTNLNGHHEYHLPAGDYRIAVGSGYTGTYTLTIR